MPEASNSEIAAAKILLRRQAASVRALLYDAGGKSASKALADHTINFLVDHPGAVVAGFKPIRNEINVLPTLEAAFKAGHTLGMPVVLGRGEPLIFRQWEPGQPLVPGQFGTEQPGREHPLIEPDIVLVPMLAFDVNHRRLGYGGGFYDRTIWGLRRQKQVITVGVAFAGQKVDSVPHTDEDEQLDFIITDRGMIPPYRADAD